MDVGQLRRDLLTIGVGEGYMTWLASLDSIYDDADAKLAWRACMNPAWMMRLIAELHARKRITRQTLTLTACAVARTALGLAPSGDVQPRDAIETAERWCRGEATTEETQAVVAAMNTGHAANDAAAYAAMVATASSDERANECAMIARVAAFESVAYEDRDASAAFIYEKQTDAILSVVAWSVIEEAVTLEVNATLSRNRSDARGVDGA